MPQVPYGDAYILQTPKIDRAIATMYAEQKQRQAQQEATNKQLEDTMSKEFANVRSVDMPDVAQKWDAYKQLRKNVLFNKDLQNDALKYNQANRAAQIALSDVYGTINRSKEYKAAGEDERKSWLGKPDLYNDDFDVNYSQYMNTPISAMGKSGIPALDEIRSKFRYQGTNYNPVKDLDAARGGNNLRSIEVDAGVAPNDALKNRVEVYKMYGATPQSYKDKIIASMGNRNAAKYWRSYYDQLSPAEIQQVNDEFNSFPQDLLKKFKVDKPELQYHNDDSKDEAVATFLAQKYFLDNQPKLEKTEDRTNEAGRLKATQEFNDAQRILKDKESEKEAKKKFENDKTMEGIRQVNRLALAKLREGFTLSNKEDKGKQVDEYLNNLRGDGEFIDYTDSKTGTTERESRLKLSPESLDIFAEKDEKGHKITPTAVLGKKDGTYRIIYADAEVGKQGGKINKSIIVSPEDVKARVIKNLGTGLPKNTKSTTIKVIKENPLGLDF